jgi:hypothetical protein
LPANTAVTRLKLDYYDALASHHTLPPNTQELVAGSLHGSGCLLPLTQLRQLTLLNNEYPVTPAAELSRLSSLTALTYVDLTYQTYAEGIGTSAGGWSSPQLRRLAIWPSSFDQQLTRDTLLAMSHLRSLWFLELSDCQLDALHPAELGGVLGQLTSLDELVLRGVQLQSVQDDDDDAEAAAGSPLAVLLRELASHMNRMELRALSHHHHHVTQSSHSINAIGPAPLWSGRKRERSSTLMSWLFQTGMKPPFTRCTFANIFSKCVFQLEALLNHRPR